MVSASRPEQKSPGRATLSPMDLELSGRRALLIGAGRGLGGAAAVALARERASVALVARFSIRRGVRD